MPTSRKIWLAVLFCILAVPALHAQGEAESTDTRFTWPAIPYSPNEPVTGPLQVLTSPQDRARAFTLLDRARQNYTFYGQHSAPFAMRVSFVASGRSQFEGNGSMEETWLDNGHHTWTAELAGSISGRSVYVGHRWAVNNSLTIPLRVQMVRSAFFWPITNIGAREVLRMQKVNFQGSALTCILDSGSLPLPPSERHWVETEYCMDEQTGLLRVWSKAPGVYAIYDYKNSLSWNGHQIAGLITFYENAVQVLQIHVENFADSNLSSDSFRPSPEIAAQRSAPGNGGPVRFPMIVSSGVSRGGVVTPVIVHVALAADGSLLDAEVITPVDPELAQHAINEIKARCPLVPNPDAQTEAFISVEFMSEKK